MYKTSTVSTGPTKCGRMGQLGHFSKTSFGKERFDIAICDNVSLATFGLETIVNELFV